MKSNSINISQIDTDGSDIINQTSNSNALEMLNGGGMETSASHPVLASASSSQVESFITG